MDRGIIQVQPVKEIKGVEDLKDYQEKVAVEFKEYERRVNEALRRINEQILKLEGRSGTIELRDSLTLTATDPTLVRLGAHGALCQMETSQPRSAELAFGAYRDTDGQWIASDSGAVILQLRSDGTFVKYANTGLTPGAAFTPVVLP